MNQTAITGIGYLLADQCGAIGRNQRLACSGPREACRLLADRGVLTSQPKNLGRFDGASWLTYACALWACVDAGLAFARGKQRIGIVGASAAGSLDSNQTFFADYVAAGRQSARGNLFAYTLPTTPLAEAALFCGFTGPLWHMHQPAGGAGRLLEEAGLFAAQEDVEGMLALWREPNEAVCFVVQKTAGPEAVSLASAQAQLKNVKATREIVRTLDDAQIKRGVQ